ncbi:zinc-ribbon domain-containing protein [Aquimarina aquimarini]|uniref:zinc-ribbon domain-containing protein n=1 Tax=Aquimarina aquimarini TaxID=1191734 RepID=UPI000D555BFF|nr:zinc-ribbon domain-containing protein [Aquimarina aquimarini]
MFLYFGTRSSRLKERKLQGNTTCPNCEIHNSFIATTFGKYFHVFWIPLFPLFKTTILECSHCKKSYHQKEIPVNINRVLLKDNQLNPVKTPLWQWSGSLILIVLFLFTFIPAVIYLFTYERKTDPREIDPRKELLNYDIDKTSSTPTLETDSISFYLKPCVSSSLEGINMDGIKYYSKIEKNKLLVLLKATNMRKIETSSRKELLFAVEDCLLDFGLLETYDCYIGVDGLWSMLLVKTPNGSSLSGKYADTSLLYRFYDTDTVPIYNNDSIPATN